MHGRVQGALSLTSVLLKWSFRSVCSCTRSRARARASCASPVPARCRRRCSSSVAVCAASSAWTLMPSERTPTCRGRRRRRAKHPQQRQVFILYTPCLRGMRFVRASTPGRNRCTGGLRQAFPHCRHPTWRQPRQRIQHDGIFPQLVCVMVSSRICTDVMHLHITAVMHLQAPGLTRLAAHPPCQRRRVRTQPDPRRLRRRRSRRCRNGRGHLIGRLCRRCGCRAVLIHGMIDGTYTGHSHAAAKMQGFALACGSYSACGSYREDVQAKLMGDREHVHVRTLLYGCG